MQKTCIVAIAVACLAASVQARADCDNTTLNGSYHFQDLVLSDNGAGGTGGRTTKGTTVFDGAGGVVLNLVTRHTDGRVDIISGSATYAVAADCTLVITVPTGDTLPFLTTPSGNFFYEGDRIDLPPYEVFLGMGVRD